MNHWWTRTIPALFGVVSMLTLMTTANATVVLDQLNDGSTVGTSPIQAVQFGYVGQSFTVGLAGTLSDIRIPVFNSDAPLVNVSFYLAPIKAGTIYFSQDYELDIPSANITAESSVQDVSSVGGWLDLNFSAFNIAVQPGEQFGLVFHAPIAVGGQGSVDWFTSANNFGSENLLDYQTLQDFYGAGRLPYGSANFATYVNVAAVPEPAVWVMMIIGFGAMGCALRVNRDKGFKSQFANRQ